MFGELNRYFIELQAASADTPRWQETALRREQAAKFITDINQWLKQEALESKVAALAITALGQVQITCEADIISHIRHVEDMNIAAIRQASLSIENISRWNGGR